MRMMILPTMKGAASQNNRSDDESSFFIKNHSLDKAQPSQQSTTGDQGTAPKMISIEERCSTMVVKWF